MVLPEPEFLEAPERRLVALSKQFTFDTRYEIPALWNDFWSRQWQLPGQEEQACYGVSYSVHPDGRFSYAVGLNIEPMPEDKPEGSCTVTLSAGRYAVFRKRGSAQEIPAMFDEIFTRWLPASGEKQREGAVFERYPYEEGCSPEDMNIEIWLPLEAGH
ncbi:GyrI-like domain-containing protein [Marinobacterium jannaschii]|uniref:GyrI-like domain-containing protein n=1 Tax=Marinobacterium jannaschii TaxID=64970 RepID=UPI000A93A8EE|nr:GyrI-like domain-containing protein [Marinobacterium jannaschii]